MSGRQTGTADQEVRREKLLRLPPEKRAVLLARLRAEAAKTARPEIPRLAERTDIPLSYAQERLWFLEQLTPGLPVFNIPLAVRVRGRLDRAALARALHAVVCRHEVLRTCFRDVEGRPVQVVATPADAARALPVLPVADLRRGGTGPAREREARRLAAAEAELPFDLRQGPPLRARLLWLEDDEHLLLLTLHHIVSDVWSLGVLLGDLVAAYAGEALAELPVQYADYAAWQRQWLQGEVLARQLAFWRGQLAGVAVLQLPTDRRRPAMPSQRGAEVPLRLSADLGAALQVVGRASAATLFMTLLAGFQVVLARHSGQSDIAVGTAVSNRTRGELEGLIGLFVNVLVLRTDTGGRPTFREVLERVREVTLGAYAHQDLPFERLVEELRPDRDPGIAPLVQVAFQLQNAPSPAVRLPGGLELSVVPFEGRTAKYDLSAVLTEQTGGPDGPNRTPGGIAGLLEYSTDLFDAATVSRFAGHLRRLLEAAAANPDKPIAELSLLEERERRQVLVEWNRTETDWGSPRAAHEVFEARAARVPDTVAIVSGVAGERSLTYAELNRQANRLAHRLLALGVGPEVRVGLCLERGAELLIGFLAVLKAGGACVPLDPHYPADRLAWMVEDAAPRAVLAAPGRGPLAAGRPVLVLDGEAGLAADLPAVNPAAPVPSLASAAYVIYTSGSTGRPKGVVVAHLSLFYSIYEEGARWVRHRPLRVLQFSSPSFDASISEFFNALAWGGTLVHGATDRPLGGPELARLLGEQAIELACFPPSVLALLEPRDFPALETVITAGEACPSEVVLRWSPGRRLWNGYGPTECTIGATTSLCSPRKLPPPIGVPIANTRCYVLDEEMGPVPVGVPGELWIGGAGVARGYLERAAVTAERFVPDPFGPAGARLYRSGDRVRWRGDGELEFLGRVDHQVKLRGFRIEPGEIEAALRQMPGVLDALVLVREGAQGDRRLVAYVTQPLSRLAAGPPARAAELEHPEQERGGNVGSALLGRRLQEDLARHLPGYMVPSAVVVLPHWPLLPNGKIDRRALPVPAAGTAHLDPARFAAPRGPFEEILAGIWAEVLGVELVGVEDDFFADLGGHSLLATRVISRLRDRVGIELPLRSLFEAPTVRGWAALAQQAALAVPATGGEIRRRADLSLPASPAPLSFAQERLWLVERLAPGLAVYNMPLAVRLTGALEAPALDRALRALIERHEALRTCFDEGPAGPLQVIAPPAVSREWAPPLPIVDLGGLGEACRERASRRLADEEAGRPFDLRRGPLLRARLLRLAREEHLLLLTLHHLVSDGWSLGVLVAELAALYAGDPLAELPFQYADFCVWQRERLRGEVLERLLAHWRRQLAGVPALQLPADRRRGAVPRHRGGRVALDFPAELTAALRRLGREAGATLFMTLLAGFQALLARYCGDDDVAVGTVVANRPRRELEELIGLFVNTLVLRTDLGGEPSFGELLARAREMTLDAYAHQELPFERLVEELRPARDGAQPPLVQALLVLQNTPLPSLRLPGLEIAGMEVENRTAKFDLSVLLAELAEPAGGIAGVIEYDADLFAEATIERLAGHFRRLLEAAVAAPERRVAELPMLGAAERRQVLVEWNRTAAAWGLERPVHELFEAQVERAPDAAAVLFGALQLSYGGLNRRANRLAHHLRSLGVGPEVRVGLCLERGPDLVAGILGVLKAGGVYVPLDPSYPSERLAFMIEDAAPRVVLAAARHCPLAAGAPVFALDLAGDLLSALPVGNPAPAAAPDNGAYLIFTSGSTGRPKGALVEHRALFHLLQAIAERWDLRRPRRVLQFSSPSFDASVGELWAALPWGGALVPGTRGQLLPVPELAALVAEQAIDTAILPPSLLALLAPQDFPGVQTLIAAGEACPAEVASRWSPGREMWNGYGPTECTVFSTTAACSGSNGSASQRTPPPIGRPIANARAYVLERGLEPAPVGVPGELYIGGAGLARGYLHRAGLTAERFVPDPFAEASPSSATRGPAGGRLYRTGDRVRWREDGELEYLGRLDHQVKLRGFRIELGEIEVVLGESPRVREAVVVLREDTPGDPRLVAYVIASGSPPPDPAALRAHCEERLPDYMRPAAFVLLEDLPLSPNGKLDRRALPAPGALHPELTAGFAAPRTPLEEVLAGAWAEVLGLERVGVEDDFFADLGGHSLLATRVVSRVRELLRLELPLRSLFDAPTVSGWAAVAEAMFAARAARVAGGPALVPDGERDGGPDAELDAGPRRRAPAAPEAELPLSFAQERLWFLEQLTPGLAVYNVPLAVRLTGSLDPAALDSALRSLVARHEVLRTHFGDAAGRPLQQIAAEVALALPRIDLRAVPTDPTAPENALQGEVSRLAAEEAARPFDLRRGPLVRALLLRPADGEHILLLTFHHIVSDGWSLGVVLRELGALYAGEPLPELPFQYADFALWQRRHLAGDGLDRQLAYWRRQLAGLPGLRLPADRPRPAVRRHRGGWVRVELPEDLAESLRRLGRGAGATLFMTLLAGFQLVLARYSGDDDIAVGTAVANRRRRELEGLIGFFVNTLVLRTSLGGEPSFRDLLARVREVTLGAFAHQDLPFEKLVEELRPARDTGQNPLVQVMLLLQNTPLTHLRLPGLELSGIDVENRTAKLDLSLSLAERSGAGIAGNLEHDSDLFEAATAARLAGHLRRLLAAAAASPDRRIAELPLLAEEERRQVLVDWNRTVVDWGDRGPVRLVHELFTAQAARTPAATAVIDERSPDDSSACGESGDGPGGLRLSYAELERRSALLAARLRRMGVGPERLVGVCLERSAGMVVALLGVLRAGGAYVPLDPELPPGRLLAMSDDAGLHAVVTDARSRPLVAGLRRPVLDVEEGAEGAEGVEGEDEAGAACGAENAVYAIYTSGSTGQPKGVLNSHGGVVNRLLWMQAEYGLSSTDRVLQKTPFSFDVSVWEFFWPLAVGAAIVVARPGGHRDPEYLAELIARQRVTVLHFVPSMLAAFLEARGMARCPGLHQVFCSGEALPDELRRRFFAQSAAELSNLYGPTEAAVDVTWWRCAAADPPRTMPIGRPIANTRIYVLDGAMEPSPVGVPGELCIAGAGLARGYLARPGQTAERFVPDPFGALRELEPEQPHGGHRGERMYRTGDLARWRADGELECLGRLDHQVKLRGFRVEPEEIEAVLRADPEVGEAVVLLREDMPGDHRLVAYVVPAGVAAEAAHGALATLPLLDIAELRRRAAERLPAYMVPSAFVLLARLPLLPNGKLDRRALPPPAAERARPEPALRSASPESELEEILAALWAEVLGVERVGVEEGFFTDLGGHSLLATQVVSRVRERLGLELPLRSLFGAPTVRGWAVLVSRAFQASRAMGAVPGAGSGAEPAARQRERIQPAARTAELPLSYAQERLWFLEQLMPGLAAYNLPLAVRLAGRLDRAALGRALATVVARHEVLRTAFRTVEGRPALVIAAAGDAPVPLPLIDLRGVRGAAPGLAGRLAAEEAGLVFDLRRGPLLRARLLWLADDEYLLLLTLHHIASDGWSLGVLVRELGALYAGEALPALPIQYADYAVWQRQWLQGEVLARQMEYWRGQLAGVPVLELPTDRPRPAVSRHRGGQVRLELPAELAASLKQLGREVGATLFMTLLAGFQALMGRYSGQDDFAVGTAVANRRRSELEGLIGFFVNTLALRASLAGDPTFAELLARGREVALGAYEHQDLPFEKLVEELRPARETNREPLVQVTFMLQNAPLPALRLPGLELGGLPVENRTAKFDLLISMTEGAAGTGVGIGATWEHDSDLFDAVTVERMAGHHLRLLAAAAADPSRRVAALPLLDESERRQLLLTWSHADGAVPASARLVHELFEAQVERTPEAVAVVAGARTLTYAELARQADRLARRLRALGVGPEVRVGLHFERGLELVAAVLGVLKAGGAYLPLDPAYPAERLAWMIEDAAPAVVLAAESHRDLVSPAPVVRLAIGGDLGGTDAREVGDVREGRDGREDELDGRDERGTPGGLLDSTAYILFTSGSTGRPKGVAMPHRALTNLIAWQLRDTPRPARTLQLAPASFDVSFQELLTTLGGGGALVLLDEEVRHDPRALARLLVRERIERLFLPFTALQQLAQAWPAAGSGDCALAEVITAGERLRITAEVAALFQALSGCRLWNHYGPTESHVVTSGQLPAAVSAWEVHPSIGRPIAAAGIYVLDGEMEPSPVGVPGELFIGGVAVARGYLRRPALTAERFVPDPAGALAPMSPMPPISPMAPIAPAGGRLYRTGDRARWRPDGELEHLGRLDQQLKLRGFRIEPGEIEAVLAASPGVAQAVVAMREDTPGDQRLVAYVVPRSAAEPAAASGAALESPPSMPELRRRCQEALPAFMVPSAFVVLERLPLLPSGKLDRRALPAAGGGRPQLAARFVAPQSEIEREVAEVWRELLRVDRVGIHDNFFDLGGHSLLAVRLHDRLQAMAARRGREPRELSVIDIFRHPTVESFARFLAQAESAGARVEEAALSEAKSERLVDGRSRLEEQQAARRQAAARRPS